MSKIGTLISNRSFNPIISDIPYNTLLKWRTDNKSINLPNAFIVSVPQDENGEDIQDAASIWMTDADGYLLNITKPTYNILADELKSEVREELITQIRNELKEEIISELNEEELNNEE